MFDMLVMAPLIHENIMMAQVEKGSLGPPSLAVTAQDGVDDKFIGCQDVESKIPDSASNSFSPFLSEILMRLGAPEVVGAEWLKAINAKVTLLQGPQHGKIVVLESTSYHYSFAPESGFEGKDRAIYLIEVQGKRYKVTINFLVLPIIWDDIQQCNYVNFDASQLRLNNKAQTTVY